MPDYVPPPEVTFVHELHPDTPIYRVFTKKRFEEMLFDKQLALVRPALWDDPHENFLLSMPVVNDGETIGVEPIRQSYYGQCWTLKEESDAIWRIYAPNKDGVRVKTTAKKLGDVLRNRTVQQDMLQHSFHKCFLGKVRYSDFTDQLNLMTDDKKRLITIADDTTGLAPARTLFLKRDAFSHEEEVRAVYVTVGERPAIPYGDVLYFDIDPSDFIEEICFDPRMLSVWKEEQAKLWEKGITIKMFCSSLYAPLPQALEWHKQMLAREKYSARV